VLTEESFRNWVEQYIVAWNSNDPDDIRALFTEDAAYYTGPFDAPWLGREEIVRQWLERKDKPGTTQFSYDVVATKGNLCVIRGEAVYLEPPTVYSNIWILRLDAEGRCSEFTEWWMEKPQDHAGRD
jgi:hypothetical protein